MRSSPATNWISTDGTGSKFQILIWVNGANYRVESIGQGRSAQCRRGCQMDFYFVTGGGVVGLGGLGLPGL